MADGGALPLLRPLLPRPSIFPSFSNLRKWRFQNPESSSSRSHLLNFSSSRSIVVKLIPLNRRRFSYKTSAVTERGGNGRTVKGKRRRKRRELWEELFGDNVEDDDDDDDGSGDIDLWKILEEIVDNVWILKAFKSYGYLLPFIILSLFFSTGPKAFLISLGVAIGPSLLFFAFQKLIGWDKRRRRTSMANQFGIEEEEDEMEITRSSRVRYNPSQARNNVNGRGINTEMASKFGGWDELDRLGNISGQPRSEPKNKPVRKRKKIRREEAAEPLLLRLLVSLFPFLSSYTNMLK
ncbi:unnamed protein product [Microthlaspi erraticum]|uniref:Uncharacterized protein n=1 Tax=Microthlaspi erraticum TaxID=1685480 RepID=A0A6D2KB62_9BRAS|nr:unnamed protein product [Microthlaspi erraticum]